MKNRIHEIEVAALRQAAREWWFLAGAFYLFCIGSAVAMFWWRAMAFVALFFMLLSTVCIWQGSKLAKHLEGER